MCRSLAKIPYCSVLVDGLSAAARDQRIVHRHVERLLDELDGTIDEGVLRTAGMQTRRAEELTDGIRKHPARKVGRVINGGRVARKCGAGEIGPASGD